MTPEDRTEYYENDRARLTVHWAVPPLARQSVVTVEGKLNPSHYRQALADYNVTDVETRGIDLGGK